MIHVRSANDIYVLNDRYAVIRDVTDTYRVVSLVRIPYRELAGRDSLSGLTYVFDRTGRGQFYKESYNQSQLAGLVAQYGKRPTQIILDQLRSHSAVSIAQDVSRVSAGLGKSELAGFPRFENYQLDPQKGGWIIATVTKDGLLFGSKPKVHTDHGAACAELQRLATVSPGTEFVLLKAVKTAVSQTVQTKEFA